MCYMCHNSHILVKRKMKQNKTIHLKKRANPCFYAVILAFTTETSLALETGKDAIIYVVNPHSLGEFNPNNDYVYRGGRFERVRLWRSWATPAYFNNTIYYGASVMRSLR